MKELISQVYELTHLAVLTPQNLVENIQLDNYMEIKYFKEKGMVVCEMLTEEEGKIIKYSYHFSMDNQLQLAYATYYDEKIYLFDRSKELKELLNEYKESKENHVA